MAVNFNTAFYQSNRVERVVNPKVTDVKEKTLNNQLPIEQTERAKLYEQQEAQVRSDKTAIELLDQQRQSRQQQDQQRTTFDKPNRTAQQALSAYQNVADEEKKQAFASLVGVDIYV